MAGENEQTKVPIAEQHRDRGVEKAPEGGGGHSKAESQEPVKPKRPRRGGSGFDRQPGRRPLKEYPLTKGDMQALAGIGILATLCFSGAAGTFGFWVNDSMAIAMSDKLSSDVKAVWETYRLLSAITCPVLLIAGCALLYLGNSKISEIMRETTHE